MWTTFWDMHSGGGQKEKWSIIYIEAPEEEAKVIFYNHFGHNPERVTCTCCGDDYSIHENESLEQASAYHRHCANFSDGNGYIEEQDQTQIDIREKCKTDAKDKWGLYMTLDEYLLSGEGLAIYDKDIKPEERIGDVLMFG